MKKHYLLTVAVGMGLFSLTTAVPSLVAQGNTRDFVAPAVFQAAGPTRESIAATITAFTAAIGGDNNLSNAGPLAAGRREIGWDGGGATTTDSPTPFNGFQNSRGALFTTPGSGFVQAPPAGMATKFGNLSYETAFQAFSLQRLFSAVGSNVTDTTFFIPGSQGTTPATTTAFGAVFADVDQPDGSGPGSKRGNRGASTFIEYYSYAGSLLFSSYVAATPGTGTFSFFGVVFNDARIGRVRITSGDLAPGPDDDPARDIVLMDDFLFGEPKQVQ